MPTTKFNVIFLNENKLDESRLEENQVKIVSPELWAHLMKNNTTQIFKMVTLVLFIKCSHLLFMVQTQTLFPSDIS